MKKINLLDHGFVRLADSMGDDLSVVRAARVSYDAAWRAGDDEGGDAKLIRYLWKHKHTTPFEAVEFIFEVKAPIFVFRQWHRHRTWSYNELSARYKELPTEFYIPTPAVIGKQSTDNKQGRQATTRDHAVTHAYERQCADAFDLYQTLLADEWPRELARAVLPVSTYSHMFAKVDLLNLMKFLTLRCDEHAQWEIRQYADAMLTLAAKVAPVSMAAWEADFKTVTTD